MSQLDVFDHSPAKLAEAYRKAAQASREQFPLDDSRARYYERAAKLYRAADFPLIVAALVQRLNAATLEAAA